MGVVVVQLLRDNDYQVRLARSSNVTFKDLFDSENEDSYCSHQ